MIDTALCSEPELYSAQERKLLSGYALLPCAQSHIVPQKLMRLTLLVDNAQYILVRLLVRTHGRWVPASSIRNYRSEIGESLNEALDCLCEPAHSSEEAAEVPKKQDTPPNRAETRRPQNERADVIDLTLDSEDEGMGIGAGKQEPVDAKLDKHLDNDEDIGDQQSFCRAAHKMTLGEIFQTLDVGSLRTIAKESKIPLGPKPKKVALPILCLDVSHCFQDDICKALLRASDSQTLLVEHLNNGGAGMKAKYKAKDAKDGKFANMKQAALSFAAVPKTKQKQQVTQQKDSLSKGRLRERGLELLGRLPCFGCPEGVTYRSHERPVCHIGDVDLCPVYEGSYPLLQIVCSAVVNPSLWY